ncbi:MAG: hypothetical protein IJV33_07715 [Bacteroidaceae bacterium]|nr:hypothetical protein [Bacteroidaceae bacterium]
MERRTYHIRKTIDIVVSVPYSELQDDTERWVEQNFVPDGSLREVDADHIIKDIKILPYEEDQDAFVVVSWPESQALCEFEDYTEHCTFIMGDELPCCSYLVNKDWYSRLCNGELRKVEELEPIEY